MGGCQGGPRAEPEFRFPSDMDTRWFTDMYSQPSTRASSDSEEFPENWAHRLNVICKKYPSEPRSQVLSLLKKHNGAACVVEHELQEIIRVKEDQTRQLAERQAEIAIQ